MRAADNMKYDAFISYRRENGSLMAKLLQEKLRGRRLRAFYDRDELQSGKFNEKIYTSIAESKNFILILSKDALDRCKDEEDWVRKEILKAVELKKEIVLIMCEGFQWPRQWDSAMPSEIVELKNVNAVGYSEEYMEAFLDKTVGFLKNITVVDKFVKTEEYFTEYLGGGTRVCRIDMAFHAGAMWHWEDIMSELLYDDIVGCGIKLRVLVNTEAAAEGIAMHMRSARREYISFADCLEKWRAFRDEYSELVEVRVCDIPLLRRYYSFYTEAPSEDTVNVKHYTYANTHRDKNNQIILKPQAEHFELFRNEFEYLWNMSRQI